MIWNKGFTELGPIYETDLPRGIYLSEFRNQVEKELTNGREVLTQIFDSEKYETGLGFRYDAHKDEFYHFGNEGWDHKLIPFLRSFNCGPRRLYLKLILDKIKDPTPEELDNMGLEPRNINMIRLEIQKAQEIDDGKLAFMKLNKLTRELLPIDGNHKTSKPCLVSSQTKKSSLPQPLRPMRGGYQKIMPMGTLLTKQTSMICLTLAMGSVPRPIGHGRPY